MGERKFPKEVVVAYVDYCKRASVCEENQRVCHMCVFIEQRCQNYIVKQSKVSNLNAHCRYYVETFVFLSLFLDLIVIFSVFFLKKMKQLFALFLRCIALVMYVMLYFSKSNFHVVYS